MPTNTASAMSVEASPLEVIKVRYGADNFAYLVRNRIGPECVVVDPGDAGAVLSIIQAQRLQVEAIWVTHGHADHAAGVDEIAQATGCLRVERAPPRRTIGMRLNGAGGGIDVLPTPGHARDHVMFHDPVNGLLFTGDALFVAGCGRVFEGPPSVMRDGLQVLSKLPDSTLIYPGHDYTEDNLAFAVSLCDPPESAVLARHKQALGGDSLIPATLGAERRTNPFLRCDDRAFRARVGYARLSPSACFTRLRQRKDVW